MKSGVNVGNGITNTKRKEDANAASEKVEDDGMERDGCDEMKSSKVVVKGLGRVIEAAWFNLHHGGIWRSFSSIKLPLGCEKLAVHKEYGDKKGYNELFRMVPSR